MDLWNELNGFSDKKIPCPLCKKDSVKTVVGDHYKCSECVHLFNEDGSTLPSYVECYCTVCMPEKEPTPKQKATKKKSKKKGKI